MASEIASEIDPPSRPHPRATVADPTTNGELASTVATESFDPLHALDNACQASGDISAPSLKRSLLRDGAADGREPSSKKAKRTRRLGSCATLLDLAGGDVRDAPPSGASSGVAASASTVPVGRDHVRKLMDAAFPSLPRLPAVVSDPVRRLMDTAFPSLPLLPAAVSSGAFSADRSLPTLAPSRGAAHEEGGAADGDDDRDRDSPAFGWFVFTDVEGGDADTPDRGDATRAASSTFLPGSSHADLAFAVEASTTAPGGVEEQDRVVQQALAADTIDDVLGDLF